jgi:hypothetical protein
MTQPSRKQKPDTRLVTATASKTGSTTTAIIDGVPTTIQVARDLTVASGDVLMVTRFGSQWFAVARGFTAAPAAVENDTAPDPKPAVIYGTTAVSPPDTGSWNGLAWRTDTTDVYQGVRGTSGNHIGAVFYGSKLTSLAGTVVDSATVMIRRVAAGQGYGTPTPTMRLITDLSRPVGAPTLSSTTTGPVLSVGQTDTAFSVPAAWVQAMVDGTAGGIGFYNAAGTPFVAFAGRGTWTPAFTLTVNWSRVT